MAKLLFESEPRISLFPARGRTEGNETGLTIGPYMMAPGDEKVVAERLFVVLSKPPQVEERPKAPPATTSPAPGTSGSSTRPASRRTAST